MMSNDIQTGHPSNGFYLDGKGGGGTKLKKKDNLGVYFCFDRNQIRAHKDLSRI